jgi:hypothetical protein
MPGELDREVASTFFTDVPVTQEWRVVVRDRSLAKYRQRLMEISRRLYQLEPLPSDDYHTHLTVEEEMELHEKKNTDFIMMETAMSKIGEPCKSLLDAYYIQKKHMQEIAADFGYTNADNAKTQKYKCLMRLKKLFFAQYKNGQ